MPKRSNEFQALIKFIYDAMSKVEGGSVTESATLYEPDGIPREIDILIEREMYGHKFKMAVECRARSREDDIGWIDGLIGKYRNLKIDKIVAVSNSGFTAPAIKKANSHGIDTRTLEEFQQGFHKLGFMEISGGFFEIKFNPQSVIFEVSPTPSGNTNLDSITEIRNEHGEIIGTIDFILDDYFNGIVSPRVKEFIKQEFLPSCEYAHDMEKETEITIPLDIKDTYLHCINGEVLQLMKLIYNVKINPSIFDAKMQHYKYNKTIVSIGTKEWNDKKGTIKIIQVSGSIHSETSIEKK